MILRAGPQLQRPQWRQSSWVTGLSQSDTRNLLEQTQLGISGYDPEEQGWMDGGRKCLLGMRSTRIAFMTVDMDLTKKCSLKSKQKIQQSYCSLPGQDMRGVFMARGPGFQKASGEIYPAIELVDVYQIFCHLGSVYNLCFLSKPSYF